jgi:hypothetical protein
MLVNPAKITSRRLAKDSRRLILACATAVTLDTTSTNSLGTMLANVNATLAEELIAEIAIRKRFCNVATTKTLLRTYARNTDIRANYAFPIRTMFAVNSTIITNMRKTTGTSSVFVRQLCTFNARPAFNVVHLCKITTAFIFVIFFKVAHGAINTS